MTAHKRIERAIRLLLLLAILVMPSTTVAQQAAVSLNVANRGWLPIAVQIIDTLCNVTIYQGKIVGNAMVATRPACVDRNRKMDLILIDLNRRQSYRFTGSSRTIHLRRRAS